MMGKVVKKQPSKHLMDYLLGQNIQISEDIFNGEDSNEKADFDLDQIVEQEPIYEEPKKEEPKVDPSVAKMDNLLNPNYQQVIQPETNENN